MDDRELERINGQVTSQIIKDLIAEHTPTRQRMISLYERYKASIEGVPIFSRKVPDYEKVNNKLNNDFFSEIVDTKVGYFMGKPIVYSVDREAPEYEVANQTLQDFNIRNNIEDLDSETAKMAAICGLGARLLYIDREGSERVMNVDPWECIFVYDRSINEPQYALRYYTMKVQEGDRFHDRTRVEWYDQENVTFFIEDGKGMYILDETEPKNPLPHMFDGIPLLAFPNNEEQQGDVEKALSLIDAYDRTLSDVNSEIEAFRLAYMVFYGFEPDKETIEQAKQTGAFGINNPEDGAKIEFLTKQMSDTIIENHLNRLEQNILRFAKSVNFGDEQFAGNLSGVSMRFKLFALESKCITAERKFTAALRQQFKLLASAWQKKGIPIDYKNIWFQFKRNFPLNLLDEAQTSATLKGLVSERTRLSLLSFIDDVEAEIMEMERDALDLDMEGGLEDEIPGESAEDGEADGSDSGQDGEDAA
ncbi:phage portal protein [Thermoflavimicrobium dichotomicum]|uniref:Phage portal protein, SPP1 family n=1 Tax=Thermoflavimicrobium dichotomicum TaxID=46223 RepID=A0A1I3UMP7_9BACL|nr:phage portal protein [Thermoflavimicrobium dichotomicum]SFJ83071.1 phage portal protein, SPP1 family [Thermoflavimicrobium dichotomicum]